MQEAQRRVVESAYAEHHARLEGRLRAATHDPGTAEDIAHEAFVRLARQVDAGLVPADCGAWLYRVAMNLVASRGRHQQVVDRRAACLPIAAAADDPEDAAVARELGADVRDALAELRPSERRAVLLASAGYGASDIGSSLERSAGATRTLLCRARAKVRSRLTVAGSSPS